MAGTWIALVLLSGASCSPSVAQAPPGAPASERARPETQREIDAAMPVPPQPDGAVEHDAGDTPVAVPDSADVSTQTPRIDPSEHARATVPIEDPHGAMRHFYERLEAVARHEDGAMARISFYSDSVNGTDLVSSALRHAMQARFGDGGKGFVPIAKGWPTHFHRDVVWLDQRTWSTEVVNRGNAPAGRYGLGGVVATSRGRRSMTTFRTVAAGPAGTAVSRLRLFYLAWPRGGSVSVAVDGGAPAVVDTRADEAEDRVFDVAVDDGPHAFDVRAVDGRVRLYGVVMERDGPGVVVDGLMLIGARARRLVHFDAGHLGRQVALRGTDLLLFWMGANDAESSYFDETGFVADYSAGIEHARAGRPDASCLVMSITDMGERPGGATRRRVPGFVDLQRQVALDRGCAFFDLFEATGGPGTARRWFRSQPRLISGDYTHLTPDGARAVGEILHHTLLRGLSEHLDGR